MIFEDVSLLQEKIRSGRPDGARLADSLSRDGEVDLLFTSSPPLFNQIATFELESLFRTELEPRQKAKDEAEKAAAAKAAAEAAAAKAAAEAAAAAKAAADAVAAGELVSAADELKSLLSKPIREEDMFKKVPVPSSDSGSSSSSSGGGTSSSSSSSLLTKYLRSPHLGSAIGGGTKLTIYLPDCSPMVVYVPETSTYEQVVNKVLATHKDKGLQPALKYDDPGNYELYLNEGDGIPDRDFVFRKTQRISENKVDEYCLCEADEDDDDHPVPTTTAFSIGGRSSMMRFDSIGSASSLPTLQPNTVSVAIPTSKGDSITVRLAYDETTTMKQLLLDLVEKKKHKIRLYTEEFSFVVSAEDQARLKLMSPFVDMNALVATFGDCKFDLQKKIFEDSARALNRLRNLVKAKALEDSKKGINPAARGTLVSGGGLGGGGGGGGVRGGAGTVGVGRAGGAGATGAASNNANSSTSAFNSSGASRGSMSVTSVVYNETTATMHQQWNIVKKNKLGSKQERIIGIDGKYIYNSKRDQRAGTGVKVPMRDISLVQSVEVLDDKLTFRINWKEDKANAYAIEYVAQNERDCAEIAAKLNKLLSMQSARRVSGRGLGGR